MENEYVLRKFFIGYLKGYLAISAVIALNESAAKQSAELRSAPGTWVDAVKVGLRIAPINQRYRARRLSSISFKFSNFFLCF